MAETCYATKTLKDVVANGGAGLSQTAHRLYFNTKSETVIELDADSFGYLLTSIDLRFKDLERKISELQGNLVGTKDV